MRPIDILNGVGGATKTAGRGLSKILGAVNPDVWRELIFVSASAYSMLMPRREKVVDHGKDEFAPVVLVHGLAGNRGAWWPFRLFMKVLGHRRVYAFGYEKGTIEEHAALLKDFMVEVCKVTGVQQVDVVAHSLGGLISRYAIQKLGMADSVRTLITMATPHQGTYAALYANTTLTLPMRPSSEMINDLNSEDLSAFRNRFFTLYSDRDVYVLPHEMMTHPAAENIFVPDISHSQYLLSPQVFRVVASLLNPAG